MLVNKIKVLLPFVTNNIKQSCQCSSVFGIKHIIQQNKLDNFTVDLKTNAENGVALNIMKKHFLKEHIFVRDRKMNLYGDCALDNYLNKLLEQGNTLTVKAENGEMAGLCVNYTVTPDDPKELRNFAFYRQDPNTKDFLYFTAKLMETPNLWDLFQQPNIFEVKMLAVLPEYRRQGLAALLLERSKSLAVSKGFNLLRLDCINAFDYKVAESAMLHCVVKYPVHKLSGPHVSFVKRSPTYNNIVRVYVHLHTTDGDVQTNIKTIKQKQAQVEKCLE